MNVISKLEIIAERVSKMGFDNISKEIIEVKKLLDEHEAITMRRISTALSRIDFCKKHILSGGEGVSLLRWQTELDTLKSMKLCNINMDSEKSIPDDIQSLLKEILTTLKEMKQQELDYWEAWKQAKAKEISGNA